MCFFSVAGATCSVLVLLKCVLEIQSQRVISEIPALVKQEEQ